jgi:hypothetical protein
VLNLTRNGFCKQLSESLQDLAMITIRTAKPSDIPELVDLLKELFSIEADFDFDPEKQACVLHKR